MLTTPFKAWILLAALLVPVAALQARHISFEPGDVFVSLEDGPVQWWTPDGILRSVLIPTVTGTGEGMDFDASGNLYVARWCIDSMCATGNTVEKFNVLGQSLGKTGREFNCQPHAIVFDAAGAAYIGQAGCRQTLLKNVATEIWDTEYTLAVENYGIFWIDLAADGCTMFYTSVGPNVKRYDVCTSTQLPDFNAAPLPGGMAQDLRVLPDGGVLVSSGEVIARLDQNGVLVQSYAVAGEGALWAGIDLAGDNTFWAANYFSSNIHKFHLDGTVLQTITTGVPTGTVVAVRVKK